MPAFEGERPDRLVGVGLNMYDVMCAATAAAPAAQRAATGGRRRLEPGPPPRRSPATRSSSCCRRSPAREPTGGYLFYDCQTDDVRLVLTVLGEAERFGAVCANGCEVTELLEDDGRAAGVRVARPRRPASEFESRADNVVNATGVWADRLRPEELHDEAEVPRHPARAAARTSRCRTTSCRSIAGRDRARRRRAHDLRAALARARR